MIVVDANVLLYATIKGFPQHDATRAWWEETLSAKQEVGLAAPALFGFLRIATNPRVLTDPMPVDDAASQVRGWLERPNVRFLNPGPRHLDLAFKLLSDAGTAGNLTTDAQLAALAIENQAVMMSNDTDFGKFSGLNWNNPLKPTR